MNQTPYWEKVKSMYVAVGVSLLLLLLCSTTLTHSKGVDYQHDERGNNALDDGHMHDTEAAFDYYGQLSAVKRALYVQTRSMQKCGDGKFCKGICCGKAQCCKKGWTCRYMPRFSRFYCIP